ncbi:copia protein [Tanacetum coccineum]
MNDLRGTIQNKVDRETRFTNEFDQFVAEPGEALVFSNNRFAQLHERFERKDNFFQLQFEKLVNVSRAKKLEKSHDPLALDDVHTNSEDPLTSAMLLLARAITQNFSTGTNNHLRTSSDTRNQAIIQGDRVNIQSRNSGNAGRNNRCACVQEEIVEGSNAPNETGNVQRTLRTSSSGNTSIVQCYNYSGKGHYARNCNDEYYGLRWSNMFNCSIKNDKPQGRRRPTEETLYLTNAVSGHKVSWNEGIDARQAAKSAGIVTEMLETKSRYCSDAGEEIGDADVLILRQVFVLKIERGEIIERGKLKVAGFSDPRLRTMDRKMYCETCMANMAVCPGHFGHIELAKPMVHIGFMKTVLSCLKLLANEVIILLAEHWEHSSCADIKTLKT